MHSAMNHKPSLAGFSHQVNAKSRPEHKRRHSISRLATWSASSGKRISGWAGKVYAGPRGAPVRPRNAPSQLGDVLHPLPPLPKSYAAPPKDFRLSLHLSFSTPTLLSTALQAPLTPPPSPPESFSSMETSFQKPMMLPRTDRSDHRLPTPPESHTSSSFTDDLRRTHSRARSISTSIGESLSLLGRRRRNGTLSSPAGPAHLRIITPPLPPTLPEKKRFPRASSPPPPLPPRKHSRRNLPAPIAIQRTDSVLLPELSFSRSPLMVMSRTPSSPQPTSPLRKTPSKTPGSPVRTGMARNIRIERRSLILQPSERESREFTRQNTLKVQKRLAEVEVARMSMTLQAEPTPLLFDDLYVKLGVDEEEKRDSFTSLDGILSSYTGSGDASTKKGVSGETQVERHSYLNAPPSYQLAISVPPTPPMKEWKEVKPVPRQLTPPVMLHQVYGEWNSSPPLTVSASSSTVSLNFEVAFSSLGGFGNGGIWRKVAMMLDSPDLARLSRVSWRVKRAVEPLLYESINLRPNYPHGFSYSYLSHLLSSLHTEENKPKLRKWTKSFCIGKGWEENQVSLLDNGAFLMDEEIIDDEGKTVVSRSGMRELVGEEGILADGGIKEVNAYMTDILNRAPKLTSLVWESPIPMRGQLIASIAAIKSIRTLKLNLSQPVRKERRKDGSPLLQWANLAKYRPSIQTLSTLQLVELRLSNLPTRGGKWWKQIWHLIASSIDTLRVLSLEMPHINHERYQNLFDRYHRIYNVPEHDDERHTKTPPVFDWSGYNAAKVALGFPADRRLQLHTLELTGFVVDEKIINWEIQVGVLKNLVLLGCIEKAGFRIAKDCWRGIEVFRSTGLGFMERVVESLYTSTCHSGERKEVCFLSDQNEYSGKEALDMLRRVVINAFPRCGTRIGKLVLKEQWALGKEELEKVFAGGSGSDGFTEMALAVENSPDAWKVFLEGLRRCKSLRRVHVLNGFLYQAGSGYGSNTGGTRRFVVDDAKAIEEALVGAWEAGSGVELEGLVVAVRRAAWRIVRIGGKWGMVRIPGALEDVVVGKYGGRGEVA